MPDPVAPPEPTPSATDPVAPPADPPAPPAEGAPEVPPAQGEDSGEGDQAPDTRDAELAALKAQLAEAAPILQAHREAEEANKTELQRANDRAAELERELTASREATARANVAAKTGLPADVVALLTGATEADILAAAEKVKGAVTPAPPNLRQRPAPRMGSGGSSGGSEDDQSPDQLADAIRKRMSY